MLIQLGQLLLFFVLFFTQYAANTDLADMLIANLKC